MRWKWPVKLASVLIVPAAVAYGLWFLLSGDALLREVSRAHVPGSNLTVVVYKDEKDLSRYRLFANDEKAIKDARIFGGPGQVALLPLFQQGPDWVRLMWNSDSGVLFIDIDLLTCQIIRDTNGSEAIHHIEGCRRTE